MDAIDSELKHYATLGDYVSISDLLSMLRGQQHKLDKWFDRYVDLFDDQLGDPNFSRREPIKRLYNHKYNEYVQLAMYIDLANYYLGNKNV